MNFKDYSDMSKWSQEDLNAMLEGESYDKAVDDLSRGQRNKLLAGLEERAAELDLPSIKGVGFWRATFGLSILAIGWIIYGYGHLIRMIGMGFRILANAILRPKR